MFKVDNIIPLWRFVIPNNLNCADMLVELARREKIAGIKPDEDLDIFMKVHDTSFIFFLLSSSVTICF